MMDLKGRRVYIAGKITGLSGYQYKFADAEYRLNRTYGADAVNPARVNAELPKETTYRQYWRMCQMMLCDCDAILMLDNWKDSPGATAEYYTARALGMAVFFDGKQAIEEELIVEKATDVEKQAPEPKEETEKKETATGGEPGWISVKERLPEIPENQRISDSVLVYVTYEHYYPEIHVAYLKDEDPPFGLQWIDNGALSEIADMRGGKVTHWMPLPEPPEEGEADE